MCTVDGKNTGPGNLYGGRKFEPVAELLRSCPMPDDWEPCAAEIMKVEDFWFARWAKTTPKPYMTDFCSSVVRLGACYLLFFYSFLRISVYMVHKWSPM